jgi:hypothetical protein
MTRADHSAPYLYPTILLPTTSTFILMVSISTLQRITVPRVRLRHTCACKRTNNLSVLHIICTPSARPQVRFVLPLPDPARLPSTTDRARPAAACSLLVCASIGRLSRRRRRDCLGSISYIHHTSTIRLHWLEEQGHCRSCLLCFWTIHRLRN